MADVFICHSSEDKEAIARPIAEKLRTCGYVVWYDEFVLTMGDSLRQKLDEGLRSARHGVVILSPSFFHRRWTQYELDGLVSREAATGKQVILPVWHDVDQEKVASYSPTLAGRIAARSAEGLDKVIHEIIKAVGKPTAQSGVPLADLIPESSRPVSVSLALLSESIGKKRDHPNVVSLLNRLGAPETHDTQLDVEYSYRASGVSLRFTKPQLVLEAVNLHVGGSNGFSRYRGRLPKNLTFDDRRRDVEMRIGRGDRWSKEEESMCVEYDWIGVKICYSSSSQAVLEAAIERVSIYKPALKVFRTFMFGGRGPNYLE